MKFILVCVFVLLFCVNANAQPYAVCDPQSDADGYMWRIDGGAWTETIYAVGTCSDGPCVKIADVGTVIAGNHKIEVYSYKDYGVYGRLPSSIVPLDFVKPSPGASPANLRLRK